VEIDGPLGCRRKVREAWKSADVLGSGRRSGGEVASDEVGEGDAAETTGSAGEELAASLGQDRVRDYGRTRVEDGT
jgi:hypothetical protein